MTSAAVPTFTELVLCNVHLVHGVRLFSLVIVVFSSLVSVWSFGGFQILLSIIIFH